MKIEFLKNAKFKWYLLGAGLFSLVTFSLYRHFIPAVSNSRAIAARAAVADPVPVPAAKTGIVLSAEPKTQSSRLSRSESMSESARPGGEVGIEGFLTKQFAAEPGIQYQVGILAEDYPKLEKLAEAGWANRDADLGKDTEALRNRARG